MGILSFKKPNKLRKTKKHNEMYLSDSGVAGTYVPNMSKDDMNLWKAKHIKGDDERVEIRKSIGSAQMLIVVYKKIKFVPWDVDNYYEWNKNHNNVRISMNGKVDMLFQEYDEMTQAIKEAQGILLISKIIDSDDFNIDDEVDLPLGEVGIIKEIVTQSLDWFPYKVMITKHNEHFNNRVGEIVEFKKEQLIKRI